MHQYLLFPVTVLTICCLLLLEMFSIYTLNVKWSTHTGTSPGVHLPASQGQRPGARTGGQWSMVPKHLHDFMLIQTFY